MAFPSSRHEASIQTRSSSPRALRALLARQIDTNCVASLEKTKTRSCSLGASQPQKTIVLLGDLHVDHGSTQLGKTAETRTGAW